MAGGLDERAKNRRASPDIMDDRVAAALNLPISFDDGTRIRFIEDSDYDEFRTMHFQMFPLDYEEEYFTKAIRFKDSIMTIVAVEIHPETAREVIVGFMSWKTQPLHACDPFDRKLMGLGSRLLDLDLVSYILTLGVAPSHRKRGIASKLISKALEHSTLSGCRAAYLHMIDYNDTARRLYDARGFRNLGSLKDFYYVPTGRQPDPARKWHDAYFYSKDIRGTQASMSVWNVARYMLFPVLPAIRAFSSTCSALDSSLEPSLPVQGGSANGYIPPSPDFAPHRYIDAAPQEMSRFGKSLKKLFS